MKKCFLTLVVFAFSIFVFSTLSWAQCPEDPNDRGECDTLNVICLDCEQSPGSGPYLVRFPLLVTHDQIDYIDSIGGFVIPLTWTHTNPTKYCSLTSYNNDMCVGTACVGLPPWVLSIFRHVIEDEDTVMHNRMMDLSWKPYPYGPNKEDWDTKILELSEDPAYMHMALAASGSDDHWWWEGDRVLLATLTFRIEDTMHVCLDTTFWPPSGRLKFGRFDAETYVPRDNLPHCFWIGPSQIRVTSPNGGENWGVGTIQEITWLSENFDGADVKIEYSTNSGTDWDSVINSTPNTGSYSWPIPDMPSEYCRVKVSDADDGEPYDSSDADFSIAPPPDFTIEVDPDTQEVQAGNSVNFDVILESLYGFAASCTLTATDLPLDASESFNPNPLVPPGTSDLQINTAVTTPPDTYTVTVTASEIDKGMVHSDTLVLIVTPPPPDFTIEVDPDTQEVQAGNSVNFDVILESLYGFAASCTLTATDLPLDASESFNPNPLVPPGTSDLQINTAVTTPPDTYTVTVTASEIDKGMVHSDTLVLIVTPPPPDFTIEASPETLEVPQGGEGSYEVILTALYGFDSPCTLTVSGLPDDASGEFDPPTLVPTDTSALTITVAETTPTGTCTLTITGTELVPPGKNQVERSVDVVLVVLPPGDFAIDVFPATLRLPRGQDRSYTVVLESISGFDSPCSLRVTGLPEGVVGTFVDSTLVPTDSTELNIFVPDTADTGTHTLTITATEMVDGKQIEHTKDVTLIVTLATWSFYIEAYPDTQKVVVGDSTTYEVGMFANTGFSAPCTLSIESGLPSGATFHFDPEVILPDSTSILTIITTGSTPAEMYELIIKGVVNPKQWDTTTAILMVQDFTISAAPDTQYVTQGEAVGYEVKLNSLFGFDEPCTLFVSDLPAPPDSGVFDEVVFTPTDSTTLNVYTTAETDTGWYTLTITAQRMPGAKPNGLEHSIQVVLKVEEPGDAGDWTDNPNAPKSFALFQNQPNPFNPETKISYYLPRACQVKLTIYNVLGQRVKTLFDGHQDAGTQTLLWDGRSDDGVQLSSGIYFYRLQADNFHQTKKMTLVK